jgi:ferredoxin
MLPERVGGIRRTIMSRPMWSVKLIRKGFPYSSLAARLTRLPLLGRPLGNIFFEGDDIMLLPRKTVAVGEAVGPASSEVLPWQVVERFIERAGFLWVMDECICRSSMGCKDYPVDLGCLFLGDAARDINPELGRPVTKEEALAHLERCRQAGLFHLVGRNRVDAVWLKVKPGERLLTICNCCTCCCLWRMLPDLDKRFSSQLSRMPGLHVRVTERCVGCGTCLDAGCMAGAISVVDGAARISDECRGCGHCAEVCPEGAIELVMEGGEDFVTSAVERLSGKVDVS